MNRNVKQLIEKILISLCVLLGISLSTQAQCDASFTISIDSINGIATFANASVIGTPDSPTVYTWYETPGTVLSNSENPSLSLAEGVHTICLKIENNGCVDSNCTTLTIPARYCLSRFSYSVDAFTGTTTFNNTSVGHNSTYLWSFGDGVSFSTDSNPTHVFENGWYYVCLNIRNADSSCSNVTCSFIRIQKPTPSPCAANFEYAYDTSNSKRVFFANQTFSDSSLHVIWLFPGGQTDSLENTTFTFDSVGNYSVCMLVSGPLCADSICKTIEIIEILPVCDARFSYTLFADTVPNGAKRIAVFENQSQGNNLAYKWMVNDSLVSEEFSPVYYYSQDGLYTVCLVAYSQNFCSDSVCRQILVQSDHVALDEQIRDCNFVMSPNPTKDVLRIDIKPCLQKVEYIGVYDITGNLIAKTAPTNQIASFALENIPKGLYIVEVKTTTGIYRQKLNKL